LNSDLNSIYILFFSHSTKVEYCFFPNSLLKLQTSSDKIVMEQSTFVSTC